MLKKLLNLIVQKLEPSQTPNRAQSPEMLAARAELAHLQDEMMLALLSDGTTENVSNAQIKVCGQSLRQKRARMFVRMNLEEP
jgi:hypothetical protein